MKVYSSETMKNLYDRESAQEIQSRIALLTPTSQRLWGKMNPAQMVAHCVISMEWAVGDRIPETMPLPARILGKVIKPLALAKNQPMRRNSPTAKELIVSNERELNTERTRLLALIERFPKVPCTTHPHSFFGCMKPQEWAILMYKHLDHHLRQFSV